MSMALTIRLAVSDDIPALNRMIEHSARTLSIGYYAPEQIESVVRHVFGVDSRLIDDGTYFVVVDGDTLAGCGGWSRRRTLYGGDQRPVGGSEWLNPASEPARIRAFFVAPDYARRGVGRLLLDYCLAAAQAAGFTELELAATLPGVPFYAALGFLSVERMADRLPDGVVLEFVRMRRTLRTNL